MARQITVINADLVEARRGDNEHKRQIESKDSQLTEQSGFIAGRETELAARSNTIKLKDTAIECTRSKLEQQSRSHTESVKALKESVERLEHEKAEADAKLEAERQSNKALQRELQQGGLDKSNYEADFDVVNAGLQHDVRVLRDTVSNSSNALQSIPSNDSSIYAAKFALTPSRSAV